MKTPDKQHPRLFLRFLRSPVFLVIFGFAAVGGYGLWSNHQAEARELAEAAAQAATDNDLYAGNESVVREAFKAWERTTKENSETGHPDFLVDGSR